MRALADEVRRQQAREERLAPVEIEAQRQETFKRAVSLAFHKMARK